MKKKSYKKIIRIMQKEYDELIQELNTAKAQRDANCIKYAEYSLKYHKMLDENRILKEKLHKSNENAKQLDALTKFYPRTLQSLIKKMDSDDFRE